MKVSVLVVAHNEESMIEQCLKSIEAQSEKPDEVVVVIHNCSDNTRSIVETFSNILPVVLEGRAGQIYARIEGFKRVSGDIVCCIDGDSIAEQNWIQEIIKPFADEKIIAVGTPVNFFGGDIFSRYESFNYWYMRPFLKKIFGTNVEHWYFWGASFAIRKSFYESVNGLEPFIDIAKEIGLQRVPDDAYLALKAEEKNGLWITTKTFVRTKIKKMSFLKNLYRLIDHAHDGRKLVTWFKNNQHL